MKIFITGVARSGTTLLARLMNAFEEVYVITEEISLEDFCNYDMQGLKKFDNKKTILIGKRSEDTVFSHRITKQEKAGQLKLIKENNIRILNVVRNGFDVVDSQYRKWGINDPLEWLECLKHAISEKVTTILYTHITTNPDDTQEKIAKHFKLKSGHNFSEYPKFVPSKCFEPTGKEYALRKLGEVKHTDRVFEQCDGLDIYAFIYYNYVNGFKP